MPLAPFIVCPETLGPLEPCEGGVRSPRADRVYPIVDGLVFMGYPAEDAEMIATTMAEERDHQGLGVDVARANLEHLHSVTAEAVDFINTLMPYVEVGERRPRALELGSGNGWFSWLLAAAGFDTWLCDFEANSLATGLNLEHANLGDGRRFVCDARYAPFADGSMDVVVCKEFAHHIEDFRTLFREANRVLRPGGTLAVMEPVRSLTKTIFELRHPDPHEGHHITWPDAYLRAIRGAGFELELETPVYQEWGNTRQPMAWIKQRAVAAIDDEHPSGNWISKLQLRVFGGAQLVMIARKAAELPSRARPAMKTIDPATMVVDAEMLAAYDEFPRVLADAARDIEHPLAAAAAGA